MRWLAVIAVVSLGVVAAAAAQEAPARWEPQWEQRPSARDFANTIPDSVVLDGVTGAVQLCCTPREDRRLECRVAFETPQNRSFGSASLRVARLFRLTPEFRRRVQSQSECLATDSDRVQAHARVAGGGCNARTHRDEDA